VEEANDELEAEEADNELEVEESGVEPEAEGADVETEIAFLGSEAKIGKMERFYIEMVHKGVVPKPPSDDEGSECPRKMPKKNADGTGVRGTGPTVPELAGCTYATFIKCDPLPFIGTEGTVGLCQWFERLESVFQISECKEKDRVKFAMATLLGFAVSENGGTRGSESGTIHSSLTKSIRGDVTSSQPATINGAVRLAYQLAGQLIQEKADEATEGEKRKGKSDRGGRGDNRREHNRRQNQRRERGIALSWVEMDKEEIIMKVFTSWGP
nr:putative reverse transcriptase domain-containing protein [Tanacetum cinerariifolium]